MRAGEARCACKLDLHVGQLVGVAVDLNHAIDAAPLTGLAGKGQGADVGEAWLPRTLEKAFKNKRSVQSPSAPLKSVKMSRLAIPAGDCEGS
jgi:hypothetical protein